MARRHDDTVNFGDRGHFVFGVAHVHVKRVGHAAHHHIADAVGGNKPQNQHSLPTVTLQKVGKGFYQGTTQPVCCILAGKMALRRGSGDINTVSTPSDMLAAMTR